MNTKALAKHYGQLTPHERLALILAASDRGDEAEAERLARSAPRLHFAVPDHYFLGHALGELAFGHVSELASAALRFRMAGHALGLAELVPPGSPDLVAAAGRLYKAAAYALVVRAEGWARFTEGLGIGPESLLIYHPAYADARGAVEEARGVAPSREEVLRLASQAGRDPANVATAESMAADLAEGFDRLAAMGG